MAALLDEAFVTYRFAIGELADEMAFTLAATLSVDPATLRRRRTRLYDGGESVPGDLAPTDEAILDQVLAAAAAGRDRAAEWIAAGAQIVADALDAAGVALPAPVAPNLPERERRAHVWIQYADGPLWIDLDPIIPDAQSGMAYSTAAETPDTLPDALDHIVRVTMVAEEAFGGGRDVATS